MAQITLNTQNEDGDPLTQMFHIEDEHAEEEAETLQNLASRAEQVPALREELSEAQSERDALRELAVNEIVRLKKLAGLVGEEASRAEEDEIDWLEGLPADRLKAEWDRAKSLDLNTEAATTNKTPANPGDNGYDELGL